MRRDTNITHRYPSMGGHILFPLLRLVPAMEILVHPLSPSAIGVRLRHALGPAGGNKLVIPIPRALVTPPIGPRLGGSRGCTQGRAVEISTPDLRSGGHLGLPGLGGEEHEGGERTLRLVRVRVSLLASLAALRVRLLLHILLKGRQSGGGQEGIGCIHNRWTRSRRTAAARAFVYRQRSCAKVGLDARREGLKRGGTWYCLRSCMASSCSCLPCKSSRAFISSFFFSCS
eukprot:1188599-Prorocentrum_minimum.AAC.4